MDGIDRSRTSGDEMNAFAALDPEWGGDHQVYVTLADVKENGSGRARPFSRSSSCVC